MNVKWNCFVLAHACMSTIMAASLATAEPATTPAKAALGTPWLGTAEGPALTAHYLLERFPSAHPQHVVLASVYARAGPRLAEPAVRQRMVAEAEEEDLPVEIREWLHAVGHGEVHVEWLREVDRTSLASEYYVISIAASTRQEAEKMLRGLIVAHDTWWRKHFQWFLAERSHRLANEKEELDRQLAATKTEIAALEQQWTEAEASLKYPLKAEQVSEVKLREILLEAELAGVKARIAAAQKMITKMNQDDAHAGRIEPLERVKATAQIEVAGILAERARLGEIIAAAEQRRQVSTGLWSSKSRLSELESRIEGVLAQMAVAQKIDAPPKLKIDGALRLVPITWPSTGSPTVRSPAQSSTKAPTARPAPSQRRSRGRDPRESGRRDHRKSRGRHNRR